MSLQIRPLSYTIAAEVSGVDLRKPLDEKTFHDIHGAFLEHCVLVFRGQPLTREQHIAFSRCFGEVDKNEAKGAGKKTSDFPEISVVVSRPQPSGEPPIGRYSGQEWHTDRSDLPVAALASLLRSVEVPDVGGDTIFANLYLAYDTLSHGMKKLLDGVYGVHRGGNASLKSAETRRSSPVAAHPIVRTHPETGRKALFMCEQVKLFVGMTPEESRPLIQYLSHHAIRPQGVYRHQWQKDDLVAWDNRCTLHIALGDYDKRQVRHMERTIVNGNLSGYVYEGPLP